MQVIKYSIVYRERIIKMRATATTPSTDIDNALTNQRKSAGSTTLCSKDRGLKKACLDEYLLKTLLIELEIISENRFAALTPNSDERQLAAFGLDQVNEELVDGVILIRKNQNWRRS
jgi:hypothetical protein